MVTDFEGLAARHASTQGHLTRSDLLATGVTRSAIRSADAARRWTNPHRGVYAVAASPTAQSPLWAAHIHLGPESIVVLRSAAAVHGISGVAGRFVPELAVPPGLEKTQRPGMHIRVWSIPDDQKCVVDGLPVTTIERTLADIARLLPRAQAVSCLDSALHLGLICVEDLRALDDLMHRRRQCVSGRRRLLEARPGTQSPLETRVRLQASDGGFPPDALQVPVCNSSGVLLGYGDMGYELPDRSWLIVEADGRSVHELPEALLHDRRRQNAFLAAEVSSIFRFTWEDARHPAYIPGVLGPPLMRAGWRPSPRRP